MAPPNIRTSRRFWSRDAAIGWERLMATPMTQEIRRVPADAAGEPAGVCSDPSQSRANHVLAGLPRADLALLAEHVQIVSLGPGEVLQRQDHPLEYAYFPHEGLMSLL